MAEKLNSRIHSIMGKIRMMQQGDTEIFPIEKMLTVRSICYNLATQYNRKFTTKTNREDQTVSVNRVS